MEPIPKFVAWDLCAEVAEENRGKWYTRDGWRCWKCMRSSPASPADRCVSSRPDFRGCRAVSARYDSRFSPMVHVT